MADFQQAYERTNRYEGKVISNHQLDRGGETYAGISRRHHPKWGGWPIVDRTLRNHVQPTGVDLANLRDLHAKFYLDEFWTRIGGSTISDQTVAEEVYDTAVNCGARRAVEWLQSALNVCNRRGMRWPDVRVDGLPSKETMDAISKACSDRQHRWLLLQVLETFQRWHYVQLALVDPTQEEWINGWFRQRVQQLSAPG